MKAITPNTEAELAQVIAEAKQPFRVLGGGTRPIALGGGQVPLCTTGLTGIRLYESGALTMVVQSGTPLVEVDAVLEAEGQRLAFEPMDHRGLLGTEGSPTIGGVIAGNVSGPRRIQVGAARDHLLGVRFVDGMGRILKNGGRVMKNVTGYDLVKLMAGSWGTLGVLTEVSLKVLPKSQVTGVLQIKGLTDDIAVQALSAALGSPFEVTGAAHAQSGPDGGALTLIRIEGSEASVSYRAERLKTQLAGFGPSEVDVDPDRCQRLWGWVRDVGGFHGVTGDVWRVSVKPSEAPRVVAALPDAKALYDWGGGLIWLLLPQATPAATVRAPLAAIGGHATLIRGKEGPVFHPRPAVLAKLEAGLRQRFDPRNMLNPGLMEGEG